jgi:hypothetical protein
MRRDECPVSEQFALVERGPLDYLAQCARRQCAWQFAADE